MLKNKIQLILIAGSFLFLFGTNGCTRENEEASGLFNVQITGDIQETMEGEATFTFIPKTDYGLIIIRLEEDELNYINLSFINPNASRVYLEPGDYNVVTQMTPNDQKEALVDYYINGLKHSGSSGSISIGISKETQLKGKINAVSYPDINSSMSGNYDAKRE
jgi:hypothetical protein